jgi:hypothetical protein
VLKKKRLPEIVVHLTMYGYHKYQDSYCNCLGPQTSGFLVYLRFFKAASEESLICVSDHPKFAIQYFIDKDALLKAANSKSKSIYDPVFST